MLVLGLDTALQRCSVAILRDDEAVADLGEDRERGHAERIAPMVAAVLKEAGVGVSDLDRIGVVVGPGGFTGVRVALAFARGLGLANRKPVIGVTSLAALAANAAPGDEGGLIAPIVDARRGQVYAGLYATSGEALLSPFVADPEPAFAQLTQRAADAPVAMIGSGVQFMPKAAGWRAADALAQIDAKAVARLAAVAPAPTGPPSPLYLRAPDAKKSNHAAIGGAAK